MLLLPAAGIIPGMAQDWNMHWIRHPGATEGEQIWFRRTFTDCGNCADRHTAEASRAQIEMASNGRFVLFVNGYNVSTDILVPDGGQASDTIRIMKYDVSRFLRPDTNVVAVWYSPCGNARGANDGRQLSLAFHGSGFSHVSDGTWLCRTNGCRTEDGGGETVDASQWQADWNATDFSVTGWQGAVASDNGCRSVVTEVPPLHSACRTSRIYQYFLTAEDGSKFTYDCGSEFLGQVRVTLRGMRRGDRISIGGLQYVCSGETDEQACRRFTSTPCGRIAVSGDSLTRDNIMSVEGISIKPYFHNSWMY